MHKPYILNITSHLCQVFIINPLPCNQGKEGIKTSNTQWQYDILCVMIKQPCLWALFSDWTIFNPPLRFSSDNIQIVTDGASSNISTTLSQGHTQGL